MFWAYLLAICAAISCSGYGFALARILRIKVNPGDAGLLGIICVAFLGIVLHLAFALSATLQTLVLGIGILLCIVLCIATRDLLVKQWKRWVIPILVGLCAFCHNQTNTMYDTGLYHLQTFKWSSEFPVVLGLANLHGRFGFNSTLFLIAPLVDRIEFGWIANLIVVVFVLIACAGRFSQVRRKSAEHWFLVLAVGVLAVSPTPMYWLGVLNGDAFASVLVLYWFSIAISLPSRSEADIALLVLVATFALTVKLSTAPLLPLSLALCWFYRKTDNVDALRTLRAAGVFLVFWMARGVVLSGCAVYPVPGSCDFSLPWAVSRTQASFDVLTIKVWARSHSLEFEKVMADWNWLGGLLMRSLDMWYTQFFVIGALVGCIALPTRARENRAAIGCLAALCVCLVYWFFTAPDVRFASGYLVAFGLIGFSVACAAAFSEANVAQRLVVEFILVSALYGMASLVHFGNSWTIGERPVYATKVAPGGKLIAVPVKGDQCWDHALPCTPNFRPEDLKRVHWR